MWYQREKKRLNYWGRLRIKRGVRSPALVLLEMGWGGKNPTNAMKGMTQTKKPDTSCWEIKEKGKSRVIAHERSSDV